MYCLSSSTIAAQSSPGYFLWWCTRETLLRI